MANRRHFLSACAAAGLVSGWLPKTSSQAHASNQAAAPPIAIFAKPLQALSFPELAKRLEQIGVQGIEATLRKGGQVEPQQFAEQLEGLCAALAERNQRVLIAASDINGVDAVSEQQLRLFAQHGISHFRMSYFRYDMDQPILPQLDRFARQAEELSQVCKSLGITALYQNHAGRNYCGAALWDLQRVLNGIDRQHLAVAFDIRHAALELSQSWPVAYAALRPQIGAVYVKDFAWVDNQPQNVPLGEGVVRPVFERLRADGLVGPLSLHVEYIDHLDDALQEQRWQAVSNDVRTLKQWLEKRHE